MILQNGIDGGLRFFVQGEVAKMETSLEQFFKVSYTEDGIPIYHLGEETKLQKLNQRAWLESGGWVGRGQAPLDKIEYDNNLVYLYHNLVLFATLNGGISIQPHEPGEALDRPGMPAGQKDVYFRVSKPQTEICFFLRGIETSVAKTTILVYFPYDEGQGVLWRSLRKHLIGDHAEEVVEQPPVAEPKDKAIGNPVTPETIEKYHHLVQTTTLSANQIQKQLKTSTASYYKCCWEYTKKCRRI